MNNGNRFAQSEEARLHEAIAEAFFWKQKYFELLQHSNQVIAMLSRPQVTPEDLQRLVAAQSPASAPNDAPQPAQPQQTT